METRGATMFRPMSHKRHSGTGSISSAGLLAAIVLLCSSAIKPAGSQPYELSTVAGGGVGDNAQATNASLSFPRRVIVDASGDIFIADVFNGLIRKVTVSTGIIRTVAGSLTANSLDGVPATDTFLSNPYGVDVDAAGNIYLTERFAHVVRKVDATTGIINVVAGTGGSSGFTGDGGAATSATLDNPMDVRVTSTGDLYIADRNNHRIRKVDAGTGIITTVAGSGATGLGNGSFSGDAGAATSATLDSPEGLWVDSSGNIYIADTSNNRIRKVTGGTINTVAGTGTGGHSGDGGAATSANMSGPVGIFANNAGDFWIGVDGSNYIRKVDVGTGFISTIAGIGSAFYNGDGIAATAAAIAFPGGVFVDGSGNVFIADSSNGRIRKIDNGSGLISTVAGGGVGDGLLATNAVLSNPKDVWLDASGNQFIADDQNHRIRKVDAVTRLISTVAGNGSGAFSGDGGQATSAAICNPKGIFLTSTALYISDSGNYRIRKVDLSTGIITTIGGTGTSGFAGVGGAATSANVDDPRGLIVIGTNLYFADTNNHRIRKIDLVSGIITTIIGSGATGFGNGSFSGDGGAATSATLSDPYDVEVDDSDTYLYIADQGNNRIRRYDFGTGFITTAAGTGVGAFSGDGGLATAAELQMPGGVFVTGTGSTIAVSDSYNNVVRKFIFAGIISRVAGQFTFSGSSGWTYLDALDALLGNLADPQGLYCTTSNGVEIAMFIADNANDRLRKVTFVTISESTAATGLAGTITKFPGDKVQVMAVGVTGDGATTLTSFAITISGSTPNPILSTHLVRIELYKSTDNTFSSDDGLIGSAVAAVDSPSAIMPSATETIPTTEIFYIAVVCIGSGIPDDGRSFTVGAAAGFLVTSAGGFGSAVIASSANKVTIDVPEATVTLPEQSAGFTGSPIAASGATATFNGQAISVAFIYTYTQNNQGIGGPPTAPGVYGVTASISDAVYSGSASKTLTIHAPAAPQVSISASPSSGTPGVMVTLTVQVTGYSQTTFVESNDATGQKLDRSHALTTSITYTMTAKYDDSGTATAFVAGPGGQSQASVSIQINKPPTADPQNVETAEDVAVAVVLKGADPEGAAVSYTIVTNPTNGTLTGAPPNVTYTPNPNFHGADSFTFKVNDGTSDSNVAAVSLTVTSVDDPPQIDPPFDANHVTTEDTPLTLVTAGHGKDLDGDETTLVFNAIDYNSGLVSNVAVGSLIFTPVKDQFGSTPATITLTDPATGSAATQTITLEWTPVNDPPTIAAEFPLDGATEVRLNPQITGAAGDVDGDPLTFDIFLGITGQAPQQVAAGASAPVYNARGLDPGTSYTVRMVATDPDGLTAEYSATFETEADRKAPEISFVQTGPGADFVTFSWRTNERSNSVVNLMDASPGSTEEFGEIVADLVLDHEVTVGGLSPATQYRYSLTSRDAAGNTTEPFEGTTLTLLAPDTTPPAFVIDPFVEGITDDGAVVRWKMSEPTKNVVRYRPAVAAKAGATMQQFEEVRSDQLDENPALQIAGLDPATTYEFEAQSEDGVGLRSEIRSGAFTTDAVADLILPSFTAGPAFRGLSDVGAIFEFSSDELTTSWIRYDTDQDLSDGLFASGTQTSTVHAITLSGLSASTSYFLRVFIRDLSGNERSSDPIEIVTRDGPDTDPARFAAGPAAVGLADDEATITAETDEPTRMRVLLSQRSDLSEAIQGESLDLRSSHSVRFSNLDPGTTHFFEVQVQDRFQNSTPPFRGQFRTLDGRDQTPPEIEEFFAEGIGTDRATMLVRSNEPTTGTLEVTPELNAKVLAAGETRRIEFTDLATEHRVEVTRLTLGTRYAGHVTLRDPQGNVAEGSTGFETTTALDENLPLVEIGPDLQGLSESGVTIAVDYNEPVELTATYGTTANPGRDQVALTERKRKKRVNLTRLESGTTYQVELVAKDAAGNVAPPKTVTFTTRGTPDVEGPVFTLLPAANDIGIDRARIRWEADEPADGLVVISTNGNLSDPLAPFSTTVRQKQQSFNVTGLTTATEYFFQVTASDLNRNATVSEVLSFKTLGEPAAPVEITAGPATQQVSHDRATIFVRFNRPTNASLTYYPVDAPDNRVTVVSDLDDEPSLLATNLTPATEYEYVVSGSSQATGRFTTEAEADVVAPEVLGLPIISDRKHDRVTITWRTNEVADSHVRLRPRQGEELTLTDPADVTAHAIEATNLQTNTTYSGSVGSTDPSDNSSTRTNFTFSTLEAPDIIAPVYTRPPIVEGLSHENFELDFGTDEPTSATVDYGVTSASGSGHLVSPGLTSDHKFRVVGLKPGTTYHVQVSVVDAAGNGPTLFPVLASAKIAAAQQAEAFTVTTNPGPDADPPDINTGPIVVSTTTSDAVIETSTDEPAAIALPYVLDGHSRTTVDPNFRTTHRLVLSPLEPDREYSATVEVTDVAGNKTSSGPIGFKTKSIPDTTPPAIISSPPARFVARTPNGVTVVWDTDEPSSSIVEWNALGPSAKVVDTDEAEQAGGRSGRLENGAQVQRHRMVIPNLEPGTEYEAVVSSADLSGNLASSDPAGTELHSVELRFRTQSLPDRKPPTSGE